MCQRRRDYSRLVTQVTGCNVESVAESEVMRILLLVRNFVEGYRQVHLPRQRCQLCMWLTSRHSAVDTHVHAQKPARHARDDALKLAETFVAG